MERGEIIVAGYTLVSVIGEEGYFMIYRARSPDHEQVLLKTPNSSPPPAAAIAQLEHEYQTARELNPIFAVKPLRIEWQAGTAALVLADFACHALADEITAPLNLNRFFRIAAGVCDALAALHRQGVVHRDIKPENIFLADGDPGLAVQARLTGFGLASKLSRERQAIEPPETIAGTLAYMAPEQTGRVNRSIDSRSDLYALGVTFYRMLTGRLPFTASDPMEWVHCHIALQPPPPSRHRTEIPAPLSDIVMKLLAKDAEDRYQTAEGLKADLERCAGEWREHENVAPFPLGCCDLPDRFLIPEKLYGREQEVETLLAAFDRVAAGGEPELVLVSGDPGVGKSALVNELHRALVPPRALFASGKFDQYKRGIPYATLAEAFEKLIRPLLGKGEAELEGWRHSLREALGPNGKLIADLFPDLKLIIGEQPPVPELDPQQAKARFQLVFRRFIGVFARPEHPQALFIDDLQWLDAATLDVIEDILTQRDVRHLLLIGAFRDNEVSSTHPLMRKLDTIRKMNAPVQEIKLAPLGLVDLTHLVADTLHCEPDRAEPLAQLVQAKTAGNPFFVTQFLSALVQEGLVAFDHGEGRWSWDLNRIHAKGYTDNVADLMAGRLTRLAARTRNALQQLACLGTVAKTSTLSQILEIPAEQVHADLQEALRFELVQRLDGAYRFVHDRIHEAAYALIPETHRAEAHLKIGRLLLAHTPAEKREEAVFEIVSQLNRGAALIVSRDEREELARLNLVAGKRAEASTAYAAALNYLSTGAALLADDIWERQRELAFALEMGRAECEFLTGDLAATEARLAALSGRTASMIEQAAVTCLQIDLYTTLGQSGRAIEVGLGYLGQAGVEWRPHPPKEDAQREYRRIQAALGGRMIEELLDQPLMRDPASLATLDVLTKLGPPAVFTDENLVCLTVCRAVALSLERGVCDGSCFAFVTLGMIAGPHFDDYEAGYKFGRLGYELVERRGLKRFQPLVYMVFGHMVMPWTQHVRAGRKFLHLTFEIANKIGDLTFAAYSRDNLIANLLMAGDPLAEVQREAAFSLAFAQKVRFAFVADTVTGQIALVRTLRGLTRTFGSFDDEQFDERAFEQHFSDKPDLALPACRYWIRKLTARFFAGDLADAADASEKAKKLIWTTASFTDEAEYHFYAALCRAACCDGAEPARRRQHLEALAAHRRQLETWAKHCPENFENRAALVRAEIARLEDRPLDAMRHYEQAIQSSRASGFVHNEALAHELAGRFFRDRGLTSIGLVELGMARACYVLWGADGKVKQLDRQYPELAAQRTLFSPETAAPQIDVATVTKASLAVSGIIELPKLIETLMRIALENAGADRGLLILPRDGGFEVAVEAKAGTSGIEGKLTHLAIKEAGCAETIVNTVIRTRKSVILNDVSHPGEFSEDVHVRRGATKSVFCLPLLTRGKLSGVLYLENTRASGAFSSERVAVLDVLAAQAAISLENARSYQALRESEERYSLIVNTAAEGIWVLGPDNVTTFVNGRMTEMLGYTAGELLGHEVTDFMFEEDAPDHLLRMERRHPGISEHYERRFRHKDGRTIWTQVSATPIFDDQRRFKGAFAMHTDITARKLAEQQIFLLNFAVNNVREAAFLIDQDAHFRYVNDEACRILGYDRDELLGLGVQDVDPDFPTERWPRHWHDLKERHFLIFEGRHKTKQGDIVLVEVNASYFEYDKVGYNLALVRDISERKIAEEKILRLTTELEDRVAQRTAALQQANQELESFNYTVSHDLRAPLRAISGYSSILLEDYKSALDSEGQRYLGQLQQGAARMGRLIDDLLAFSRSSRTEMKRETVDMSDLARDVYAELAATVPDRNIRFSLGRLPSAQCDRPTMRQVWINLLGNAIKYTRPRTEAVIEVSGTSGEAETIYCVRDNGVGFDMQYVDKLFGVFRRLHAADEFEGMGIGLAIVKRIVERHGGRVWAEGKVNEGAAFYFTLPIVKPEGAGM